MPTHCDHRQCPIKADPTILGFRLWFSFPRISGRCISDLGEQKGCSRRDPRSVMCVSDLGEQKGCSRRDPRSVVCVFEVQCDVMWFHFVVTFKSKFLIKKCLHHKLCTNAQAYAPVGWQAQMYRELISDEFTHLVLTTSDHLEQWC